MNGNLHSFTVVSNVWSYGSRRTTPNPPCTPNWIQKAPAERALKEEGKIQRGMKASETMNPGTIDKRIYVPPMRRTNEL